MSEEGKMIGGSENRRERRFKLNQPVSVRIQGPSKAQSGTGAIVDISEHGLSFSFRWLLKPGDLLTVEYEGCSVRGVVRHCRVREYAHERQYLIGVSVTQVVQGEQTWVMLIRQCCGED